MINCHCSSYRYVRRFITLAVVLLISAMLLPAATFSARHTQKSAAAEATANTRHEDVPPRIQLIGSTAEDIYDALDAGDFREAERLTNILRSAAADLPDGTKATSEDILLLHDTIQKLEGSTGQKKAMSAMEDANKITRLAAGLSRPYNPVVPVEVALLDYYGRELVLNARAGNVKRLSAVRDDITRTWEELRPGVLSSGGKYAAKRFDGLVERIRDAVTPRDYASAAGPILDEVDNLEKVFEAQ